VGETFGANCCRHPKQKRESKTGHNDQWSRLISLNVIISTRTCYGSRYYVSMLGYPSHLLPYHCQSPGRPHLRNRSEHHKQHAGMTQVSPQFWSQRKYRTPMPLRAPPPRILTETPRGTDGCRQAFCCNAHSKKESWYHERALTALNPGRCRS
jgi:hypothetical protein